MYFGLKDNYTISAYSLSTYIIIYVSNLIIVQVRTFFNKVIPKNFEH